MAEFFTHNAPDYGEEDTLLGPLARRSRTDFAAWRWQ
jgi:hypothetical protein